MSTSAAEAFRAAEVVTVDTGTARVPVRRLGAGPALLLVHGFPLSGFTWRFVATSLAARFTCLVPDLPGLGASEWTVANDFGFPGQGHTLHAVADGLGLDDYGVLAQDTGGTFARFLALEDPRVRHLVLINTEIPGHRPPWIPTYQALMRLPGAVGVLGALVRSRRFVRSSAGFGGCFLNPALLDGEFHTEFVEPIANDARRREGIRRYLLGTAWGPVDELAHRHAELGIPVRLVWGTRDPTFPIDRARSMLGQFPQADLVEIAGARLLPHEECPAEVVRAVEEHVPSR